MARFDVYETGFDNFNETLYFGKRAIDGKSLYEICTLAVIRSSDALSKSCGSRIKTTSYYEVNGSIYLGIGNCLRILNSIDEPDLFAIHEFDDNLDGISVSSCGRFLLICTQNGQIYISDLAIIQDQSSETKESVCSELSFIFTTKVECALQDNTENFYLTVFADETSKVPTFYAVTCTGLVEKITRILDEEDGEHFVCEQVYDSKQNIHIAAFAYPYLCMEGTELVILDLRSMDCQIDDAFGIKSLHSSGPHFLAFDKKGNMYRIDSSRCLVFGVNNAFSDRLSDFEQLRFIGSEGKQIIVAVTKQQDIQAFRSLTDSDAIYDIYLEHPVYLNNNIKGYTEEIPFLSEVYKNNILVELRLQIITTTDPEVRVRKLIDQGQIEKAEFFAAQFNVDPECIAQVKAFNIIAKSECTSEDIGKFLSLLDSMKSIPLRLELCDAVGCKTGEDTRRVLRHAALSEISAEDSKMNSNTILMRKFSAKLRKFDTYMNVYKEYNQQQWSCFVDCDLIEEVKKFLGQGGVEEATVLVLSGLYSAELAAALTDVKVKEVMSAVNEQSLEANKSFLNAFIPLTLRYKPDAIEIFVEWMSNRAIQMEKYIDFPDCAIRFLKDVSSIIMHSPPQCHLDKARGKLLCLRQSLENIQRLKNNFQVHLSLKDCLDGPYAIVSTLLNVCIMMNCDPTKLRLLMKEFLYPFLLECQEHPDVILLNEIQRFFNIEETYWLDTAYVLLEFVSKVDHKLSIIKEILIRTSKPWSDKVKKIASLAFNHSAANPLTEEISSLLKNEQFLILLEKYNINENNFVSWEDKEFYFRRILYLNGEDCNRAFNDIRQLCDQDDSFQADYLMMREFVFRGHAEEAFILMDKMEPQYICVLGRSLLHDICFKTRKFLNRLKLRDIFYNALRPLWNRLKRHCTSRELDAMLDDYNTTRAIYWMHINFKIDINLVLTPSKLETNIAICLSEINNLEPETEFNTIIGHCKTLSSIFGETLDTVLLKYVNICEVFDRVLKIGEYLLEVSQSPQILTQCAVNILKCLQRESDSMEDNTFLDISSVEMATNGSSDNDLEAVRLARELCVKAVLCHVDGDKITLTSIVEVLRLIDCHFNFGAIGGQLDVDVDHHHHACLRSPIFSLNATMTMMLNMYAACKDSFLHDCSFFKSDQRMNVQDVSKGLETFIWNTRTVLNQKQQLIAFNMIQLVQQTSLILPESRKKILSSLDNFLIESVLPQTMEALLAEKYMDTNILLHLMLFYDNDSLHHQILKYLRLYKKQPTKVHVIAQISLEAISYKEIQCDKKPLLHIMNVSKWWFRFKDSKINYASFFHTTPMECLEVLMKEEKVTVNHLPEFCADFELDLQTCYCKYLKSLLLNWRPNITYTTEINGNRNIKIQNSEQELLDKCLKVLNCISDLNGVLNLTTNMWNSVNFYYYEVYLAILEIHQIVCPSSEAISELYGPLLYFLKTYGRVNKPTRTEIEMWCGANPLKPLIDPLSEFRLPLTSKFLSNDIWSIIKPEVNLDSYKQWFKLADFLSQYLKKQDICFYAITSPISNGLIDTACSTWELSLKYDFLLSKVENCAYSMDNLEQATAAVYSLMGQMPNGADKVELAKLSYKFAKLYWESTTDPAVKQTLVKVKQRYFNYSASHILHKYQLADVKYLELVAQPSDLISELYNDSRIESYYNNVVLQCPGINRAVVDLCYLFQLNVLVECKRVLVEFLSSDFHINLESRLQQGNGTIELIRASYLCNSEHLVYWQKYLAKLGFNDSEDNEMVLRANALRCFYNISSVDTIEQMCNMTHDEFVNYLNKVSIIAKLANLGIKCESVTKLDEENQKRLLRNLAKLNNPLAIQCIAAICRTYGFNDFKYWEYVVNMANQFKMYDDLRGYLQFLSNRCIHDYMKKAWYVVLNHAFNHCKWEAFSEAEIYLLIQNCPIYELDFEPYIQKCIDNQRPDLANILKDITNKPV